MPRALAVTNAGPTLPWRQNRCVVKNGLMQSSILLAAIEVRTRLTMFLIRNFVRPGSMKTSYTQRVVLLLFASIGILAVYKNLLNNKKIGVFHQLLDISRLHYDDIFQEKDGFLIAGKCDQGHDSKCTMLRASEQFSDQVGNLYFSFSIFVSPINIPTLKLKC